MVSPARQFSCDGAVSQPSPPHPRSGAVVSCNEVFGGNSLQAELGLGHATSIVALELLWPKGKKVQRFTAVPLDRVIVVDEDATEPTLLPPPPR